MTGVVEPQDWITGSVAVFAAALLFGLPAAAALWHVAGVRLGLVGDDPNREPVMRRYAQTRAAGVGGLNQPTDTVADTGVIAAVPAPDGARLAWDEQVEAANLVLPHPARDRQVGDWFADAVNRPTPVTVAVGTPDAALPWRTRALAGMTGGGDVWLQRRRYRRVSAPAGSGRHRTEEPIQ